MTEEEARLEAFFAGAAADAEADAEDSVVASSAGLGRGTKATRCREVRSKTFTPRPLAQATSDRRHRMLVTAPSPLCSTWLRSSKVRRRDRINLFSSPPRQTICECSCV